MPSPTAKIDARVAPASGTGEVVAVLGAAAGRFSIRDVATSSFGRYQMKTLWISTDPADHVILVRVMSVGDAREDPGFVGGDIPEAGGMPTQLRLGPEGSVQFGDGPMPESWRVWSSGTLVAEVACYAFQIDTERSTDHIVFEVID